MNSLIYAALAFALVGLAQVGRRVDLRPRGPHTDDETRQRAAGTVRRGARTCEVVAMVFAVVAVVILF